jgi:uncharacterized RDD family membrane protein YckC
MPFLNRRLKSIVGDFMFLMAIYFPVFIIVILPPMIMMTDSESFMKQQIIILTFVIIPYSLFLFTFFNKDFFYGRSVAKRIQGYQVVDFKTGEVATEMQCMIRNITIIIWPIEALFVLFTPRHRLGDIIAKTRVIDKEQIHPETILSEIEKFDKSKNYTRLIITSIFSAVIFDAFSIGLPFIL